MTLEELAYLERTGTLPGKRENPGYYALTSDDLLKQVHWETIKREEERTRALAMEGVSYPIELLAAAGGMGAKPGVSRASAPTPRELLIPPGGMTPVTPKRNLSRQLELPFEAKQPGPGPSGPANTQTSKYPLVMPKTVQGTWLDKGDVYSKSLINSPLLQSHRIPLLVTENSALLYDTNTKTYTRVTRSGIPGKNNQKLILGPADGNTIKQLGTPQELKFVQQHQTALAESKKQYPFGPFTGQVEKQLLFSENVPKSLQAYAKDLIKELNLAGRYYITSHADIVDNPKLAGDWQILRALSRPERPVSSFTLPIGYETKGSSYTPRGGFRANVISLDPRQIKTPEKAIEVLTHELGHRYWGDKLSKLPAADKKAVEDRFQAWLLEKEQLPVAAYIRELRGHFNARDTISTLTSNQKKDKGKDLDSYWRSFDEFIADQLVKARTTSPQSLDKIDKFFDTGATNLRRAVDRGLQRKPELEVLDIFKRQKAYEKDLLDAMAELPAKRKADAKTMERAEEQRFQNLLDNEMIRTKYDLPKIPPKPSFYPNDWSPSVYIPKGKKLEDVLTENSKIHWTSQKVLDASPNLVRLSGNKLRQVLEARMKKD